MINNNLFSFKLFFIAVNTHLHLLLELRVKIFTCSRANFFFINIVAGGRVLNFITCLKQGFGVIL